MKRILVDMDGVLADIYTRYAELYKQETGLIKPPEQVIGKREQDAYEAVPRWVAAPGFFRNLPLIADSREILEQMNRKHEILIVSMATEFPESLTEKQLWINDNYPFISWKQVVFCGDKSLIPADIMIDDHLKNLDHFRGDSYMFLQPHNIELTGHSHKRVASWKELAEIFL